ncbi:porin [Roseateles sp. DAIF2]|uniref:porin n=1 Tax=Roseateles sp. DAIF2 TaxID=2714952 RepID=UPI0018A2AF1A|nr:porin [Roseateles sp. DAIF2]QPF72926.1 porin [Roseateles sp. DAIF2]
MKKSLVALAALASFAGVASAQSSVTLFGVVDLAARYTKANGQNNKQLANDGKSSSRFGIRGEEDLGGGLKAGFWLESPLAADTGAAGNEGRFWDRRATVSLMGEFGEVRLGRGKTSHRLVVDDFDVHTTTGLGGIYRLYSSLGNTVDSVNRSDNQVQYFLPGKLNGVYGSVEAAAGEGADGKKSIGGRLGYKAGPLHVAGAYQTTDVKSSKYKLGSLGASYDFGIAKANVLLSQAKFGALKQSIFTIGAVVPVGAAGQVLAQFSKASGNAAVDKSVGGDAKMYSLGYEHNLSKRTALYTTASYIDNGVNTNFRVASNAVLAAKGGRSGGVDVGIRHSF